MRVDLILTDRKHYSYEGYAARAVSSVFEKLAIPCGTIYLADGGLSDYLIHLESSPPKWTVGFSLLTAHQTPLCDIVEIPHFYWTAGSLSAALHFLHSPFGKIGIHDPALYKKLSSAHRNVYFLPPGIDLTLTSVEKTFDLVIFGDLIDLECLKKTWHEVLSAEEIARVENAIELQDPLVAKNRYFYAEQYLKGIEMNRVVQEVGHSFSLDIFGEHMGNNWLVRLPSQIHLHAPLPYSECFELLRASKMALLNPDDPWHDVAIAAGCLPLPLDPQKIAFFLKHPEERERKVAEMRSQITDRTWETQVRQLIAYMNLSQK